MPHKMHFEVYEDEAGEFRWRLVAANDKIIADSGEGYVSQFNAERAVESLNDNDLPVYIRPKDEA
jgi:uncharacterized protein YegP (UPF0339 family)